jgi:cytidyltransferase-like protein
MTRVAVFAPLDRLDSADFRFLEEAARFGELDVVLWSDAAIRAIEHRDPKYPQSEREYVVNAVRQVRSVQIGDAAAGPDVLPALLPAPPDVWVVASAHDTPEKRAFCARNGVPLRTLGPADLAGFPEPPAPAASDRKKVVVTGCYDFFHSGHVRFFEEVSQLGDLYVVVGNDENVRLLKGPGHPMQTAAERRYTVGSIRFVRQALVATGFGWVDAEPEIGRIKPDLYAVNEDGDKPEKRAFCAERGIEYVILKRVPKTGLQRRSSTDLRGY